MSTKRIIQSVAAVCVAVGLLTACGGSGGGLSPLPVAGVVSNSISPGVDTNVAAGQRIPVVSEAKANGDSVTSHRWTVTQVGGTTYPAGLVIADANCAGAVVVPGNNSGNALTSRDGVSTCVTQISVPLDAPSSSWLVQNTARSGTGSASRQFTLNVASAPVVTSGFSLVVPTAPQMFVTDTTAVVSANYNIAAGTTITGPVVYSWSQVSGPAVAIAGASSSTMSFSARTVGDYVFKVRLEATLNGKLESRESTVVAIVGTVPPPASTFTVSAGTIKTGVVNTAFTLQGVVGGSAAPSDLTYSWSQVSGPSTPLYSQDTLTPQFQPTLPGDYVFELRVTQNLATPVVKTSRVLAVVSPSSSAPYFGVTAGDAQMFGTVPQLVTLKGLLVTSELASTSVTTTWTQLSGPNVILSNSSSLTPTFTATEPGLYVFTLTAATGTTIKAATTSVLVRTKTFVPSAGVIQTSPANAPITLNGVVTGPSEGTVPASELTYQWTQISGPAVAMYGASTLTPQFTAANAGDYVFELTVTQAGAVPVVKTARTLVVVYPSANYPYFGVLAGDAQVIGGTPIAVFLKGSAIINGTSMLVTYQWTQTKGPVAVTISNADSLTGSFIGQTPGNYEFVLSATSGGVTKTATTYLVIL